MIYNITLELMLKYKHLLNNCYNSNHIMSYCNIFIPLINQQGIPTIPNVKQELVVSQLIHVNNMNNLQKIEKE